MQRIGRWAAVLTLISATRGTAFADASSPAAPDVQSAVVIVSVSGVDTTNGNAPVASQGTGFFISKSGFLVTSNHLVTDLRRVDNTIVHDIDRSTITYRIQTQRFGATPIPATYIDANPAGDILILYAPLAPQNIHPLRGGDRDSEHIVVASTPIFDPGYPAGLDYNVSQGFITSWIGPLNPLTAAWTTNLTYKDGQSGSPIVVGDGHVIAVVKGVDEDATQIGFVVPVQLIPPQYWDGSFQAGRDAGSMTNGGTNDAPRVVVKAEAPIAAAQVRLKQMEIHNDACASSQHKDFPYLATNGWAIDPNSIHVELFASRGAVRSRVESRSAGGFIVGVDLQNDGQCSSWIPTWAPSWAGGSIDIPAYFKGSVSYVETEISPQETSLTIASTAAIGNAKVVLPQDSTARLSFSVEKADGRTVSFIPQHGEIQNANGQQTLDASKIVARLGLGSLQ